MKLDLKYFTAAAMKEDKENTRPKDIRADVKCEDGEKSEKTKEKKEAMTKIIIRRLPPTITKDELEEQLQPLPEMDYMEFFSNDTSLYPHLFSRAYINFKNQEDIVLFRDRFDGYVFIDSKGQEYPAIVEFAPFQKTAKKRTKKKDAKCGTIIEDSDYKRFLEYYNGNDEKLTSTPETLLEEIEAKSKELGKKSTPLLDFLKNKQRLREEKKEERRRRELERKRLRDEERRKWREEDRKKRKESDRFKRIEKTPDKDQVKDEPKIKLLKKPERSDDGEFEKSKEKFKKPERPNKEDRPVGIADHKRRLANDRGRRDEEGRKEYKDHMERDRDRDREREVRDREKERRLKDKERFRRQDDERRRRRERQDGENTYKKREEFKREKENGIEKKKSVNMTDSQNEKSTKENKEDNVKRERLRNKDRPAIQLYQPGARSRNRSATTVVADPEDTESTRVPEKGND